MTRAPRRNVLVLLAMLALVVCVFMPLRVMPTPNYTFMVTFDISQSMNVRDVLLDGAPASRHAFARESARELLQALPCGSRLGWSIFTQRRVLPLVKPVEVCEHYAGLLTSLDLVDGRMRWANGSSVGRGLHQSIRSAHDIDGEITVLFLTDGHEAPPLRPDMPAMPSTDRYEVDGLIAGVGGDTLSRIPKLDDDGNITGYWQPDEVVQNWQEASGEGNEELSSRRDAHLRDLGQLSGLEYVALEKPGTLAAAARVPRFATVSEAPVDYRWIPASLALLLLAVRFLPTARAAQH